MKMGLMPAVAPCQSQMCAVCRGVGAASLRVVPMAVVSFGTYEAVRLWLTALEESLRQRQAAEEAGMLQQTCTAGAS